MHSNKTSSTQCIALVAAYATTEQHHQSLWCRCSDVARHLFCRWQLCVENRHPLEVHQLQFLTWNICQRGLRFTCYVYSRGRSWWNGPKKQETFFNDHGSKQNGCLLKDYKKPEAMEKVGLWVKTSLKKIINQPWDIKWDTKKLFDLGCLPNKFQRSMGQ